MIRSFPFDVRPLVDPRRPWPLVLALGLGIVASVVVWSSIDPQYEARGALWIESGSSAEPTWIRSDDRAHAAQGAWIELLRSSKVLGPVVAEEGLQVEAPADYRDAFRSFALADRYAPGRYLLRVAADGRDFVLSTAEGALVQQGRLGSPLGEKVGFRWFLRPGALRGGAEIPFTVLTPGEAEESLRARLEVAGDLSGNFVTVSLRGEDPERIRGIVDAILVRHVEVAAELKLRKYDETVAILEEQLEEVEARLMEAERALALVREAASRHAPSGTLVMDGEEGMARRRIRATENLYDDVRRRVESARLERATATPDARILDLATVSPRPVDDPRRPLVAAILLGCLGLGYVPSAAGAWRRDTPTARRFGGDAQAWAPRLPGELGPLAVVVLGGLLSILMTLALLGA